MNIIVFQDTFTEASDTSLSSHTPDIGSGWTFTGGAGIDVIAASDHAIAVVNNNGNRTTCNNNFNTRDMTVQGTFRIPFGDPGSSFTFYGPGARASNSTAQCDEYFTYDYDAAGGSYNLGGDQLVDTTPNGSAMVLRLECKGDILTGFSDGVEKCTLTDVTSTGQFAGILLGSFAPDLTYTPVLDDFTVEVAAPETKLSPASIKRPWTTQPPPGTKIDHTNPLAKDLVEAFNFVKGNTHSSFTSRVFSKSVPDQMSIISLSGRHSAQGILQNYASSTDLNLSNSDLGGMVVNGPEFNRHTITVLFAPMAISGNIWSASSVARPSLNRSYDSDTLTYRVGDASVLSINPALNPVEQLYIASWTNRSSGKEIWVDGALKASDSIDDTPSLADNIDLSLGAPTDVMYALFFWHSKNLTPGEIQSLHKNPWQLFEPEKIMIPNTDPLQLEVY
jgi:hypothetical protein